MARTEAIWVEKAGTSLQIWLPLQRFLTREFTASVVLLENSSQLVRGRETFVENACHSCSWQICKYFYSTNVALIAHSTNADGTFVRTVAIVCARCQTNTTRGSDKQQRVILPSEQQRGMDTSSLQTPLILPQQCTPTFRPRYFLSGSEEICETLS